MSSLPATKEAMMEGEEEDSAAAQAAQDGGVERSPSSVCCICLDPWTCYDAHRICCIPCGHVYGRSCLEWWFFQCNEPRAKCPQCSKPFALNKIINIYEQGNVWDGCCHIQELKAHLAEVESKLRALEDRQSNQAKVMTRLAAQSAEGRKLMEKLDEAVTYHAKDAVEVVKAEFLSMKEQMERLAEQNATAMDLIKFMEQNGAKVWDSVNPSRLRSVIRNHLQSS